MNHVFRFEIVALCDFGLSRFASAERATLRQKLRTRCAVNGPINAATSQERAIGSIDNRIYIKASYRSLMEFNVD